MVKPPFSSLTRLFAGGITCQCARPLPKNPVVDDVTGRVQWNVTVKWAGEDLPIPYTAPDGIFVCVDYTGVIN